MYYYRLGTKKRFQKKFFLLSGPAFNPPPPLSKKNTKKNYFAAFPHNQGCGWGVWSDPDPDFDKS